MTKVSREEEGLRDRKWGSFLQHFISSSSFASLGFGPENTHKEARCWRFGPAEEPHRGQAQGGTFVQGAHICGPRANQLSNGKTVTSYRECTVNGGIYTLSSSGQGRLLVGGLVRAERSYWYRP